MGFPTLICLGHFENRYRVLLVSHSLLGLAEPDSLVITERNKVIAVSRSRLVRCNPAVNLTDDNVILHCGVSVVIESKIVDYPLNRASIDLREDGLVVLVLCLVLILDNVNAMPYITTVELDILLTLEIRRDVPCNSLRRNLVGREERHQYPSIMFA